MTKAKQIKEFEKAKIEELESMLLRLGVTGKDAVLVQFMNDFTRKIIGETVELVKSNE